MTVTANDTAERYTISGTGPYPFSYRIFHKEDLLVHVIDSGGVSTLLSVDANYTVSDINEENGGSLSLTSDTATLYDAYTLDIRSDTPLTQPTNVKNQSSLRLSSIETAFDRLARQIQDMNRKLGQAIRFPDPLQVSGLMSPITNWLGRFPYINASGTLEPATSVSTNPLTKSIIAGLYNPQTAAESNAGVVPVDYSYPPGDALRHGVDPTGALDSTAAIQNWVNACWSQYQTVDGQGLWSGGDEAAPILKLPPGKYRVSDTIYLPPHITFMGTGRPAHTVSHTRLIMDSTAYDPPSGAGDNRDKPMFKFSRGSTPAGGVLVDSATVVTIDSLEFWYVNQSNDFSDPLNGAGIGFNDYPDGGTLVFDVDAADVRIVNCCFQHSPAPIRIINVELTPTTRPDGFSGNRGVGIFFENCEFDSGACHIFANNSYIDLTFKTCQFFDTRHVYDVCTGRVAYQGCRFHGGVNIDTAGNTLAHAACDFDEFTVSGCTFVHSSSAPTIAVNTADVVHISDNIFLGASGQSCIELTDVDSGSVGNNTIDSSGFNASAGTGIADFVAAIKGRGCRNMKISDNTITATASGTYNGFGILLGDSGRASQTNYVTGNAITAPFNGATHAGQSRYLNVAAGDVLGVNYSVNVSTTVQHSGQLYATKRLTETRLSPTYGATVTLDTSLGNQFAVVVTDTSAFAIAAPTNVLGNQRITVQIMNFSGGVMGTITWNAIFKMATWTNPANNFTRAIDFEYDSAGAWREVSRTPADVPN